MDSSVRRNFIWLFAVLFLVIVCILGYRLYTSWQAGRTVADSSLTASTTASSTTDAVSANIARQQVNLSDILNQKIAQDEGTSSLAGLDKKTLDPAFATSSLKIISGPTSTSSLIAYGQAFKKALAGLSQPRENDAVVMLRALETNQPDELGSIQASIAIYGQIISNLQKIAIPKAMAGTHLAIINEASQIKTLLGDMDTILDTPNLALESAVQYRQTLNTFAQSLVELNGLFRQNGVSFGESDNQQIFLNIN